MAHSRQYGTKRAVLYAMGDLQDRLNMRMSNVFANFGSQYTRPAPDKFIPFRHDRFIGQELQIEVWEESADYENPQTFFHTFSVPAGQGRTTVIREVVVIRATLVNKYNRKRQEMIDAIRNIAAAIVRTLIWTDFTDAIYEFPPDTYYPLSISIFDEPQGGDDAQMRGAVQCVVRFEYKFTESDVNNASGGPDTDSWWQVWDDAGV